MANAGALIVGASLAGLRLAEQLRSMGYDGPMTIVGAERHWPYNRPPLSKAVLFEQPRIPVTQDALTHLTFSLRPSLADVSWRLGVPAVSSDLNRKIVTLADDSELSYDVLGIATGLTPRRLPYADCQPYRHVVRTIEDALRLRQALTPGAKVIVVGGGFIGCEVAASATKLGCSVTVVEPLALPMVRAIGVELAQAMCAYHESQGVTFRLQTGVAGLADRSSGAKSAVVTLSDGSEFEADVIVEAIGSICNTQWLNGNDLDLTDGVLTCNTMRAGDYKTVAAAGDVARFPNPRFDQQPRRVEHWAIPGFTAKRAAASLAEILCAKAPDSKLFEPMPSFWSDQFDVRMQSIGLPALGTSSEILEGSLSNIGRDNSGVAIGYTRSGRLIGAITIGLPAARLTHYRNLIA